MSDLKCPHCNTSGSNMITCKVCNTIFCEDCEETLQGAKIKYGYRNQCPICQSLNQLYYVYNGSQR